MESMCRERERERERESKIKIKISVFPKKWSFCLTRNLLAFP